MYIALDLSHKPVPHDHEKRESISDERKFKCLPPFSEMNCTMEQFSCITGGCVPRSYRCDGKLDCKDGTDEYMCRK